MLPTFSYRSRACCVEIISQYRCLVGWGGSPKNGPLSLLYISDKNWQKTFQVVLYKRDKWRRLCGGHNLHQINNESWEQLKKVRIRNFISLFCVLLFVACKSLLSSSSFLDWEKACLSVPFLHASNHGPQILWLYTDQIISFLQLRHSRKRLYLGLQKWHLSRIWRKFEAILLGRVVL